MIAGARGPLEQSFNMHCVSSASKFESNPAQHHHCLVVIRSASNGCDWNVHQALALKHTQNVNRELRHRFASFGYTATAGFMTFSQQAQQAPLGLVGVRGAGPRPKSKLENGC